MSSQPEPTDEISTDQSWRFIWNELKRVGMTPGKSGPHEESIDWGENANQSIEGLKAMNLPVPAICHVGVLVQAAIRTAEVQFRREKNHEN